MGYVLCKQVIVNNGSRFVCLLFLVFLLHTLSDESYPSMKRKILYCALWRCLLHSNSCFIEWEMSPWTNSPKIAVHVDLDSVGKAEWQTEDTARSAIGVLFNFSMWNQGIRRLRAKLQEVNWSYHFRKYFRTIYLCAEALSSLMPRGKAREFPWLAVPPCSGAEIFSNNCLHSIFVGH